MGSRSLAPTLGFRRIAAVRMWRSESSYRFEVDGVVHRHPVTRPVSAATASRLVAGGVPFVVRDFRSRRDEPC